jgi:hypothetical protein
LVTINNFLQSSQRVMSMILAEQNECKLRQLVEILNSIQVPVQAGGHGAGQSEQLNAVSAADEVQAASPSTVEPLTPLHLSNPEVEVKSLQQPAQVAQPQRDADRKISSQQVFLCS